MMERGIRKPRVTWRVGELARATGITVRTLHHYDEIGLFRPSGRTSSGHRLYTRGDLERLQHIVALRNLGFSLEHVREVLLRREVCPLAAIRAFRESLRSRRAEIDRLDERLADVERVLAEGGEVSTERLLQTIERMTMYEKYLSREQLTQIQGRTQGLPPERLREAIQKDWPELVAAIREEASRGTDPLDPKAQALARRWSALTAEFTGEDSALSAGLLRMYESDAEAFARDKVGAYGEAAVADLAACVRYIARALAAGPKLSGTGASRGATSVS